MDLGPASDHSEKARAADYMDNKKEDLGIGFELRA